MTGSAGIAVVTKNKAALWTDSRYYLQAEMQLNKQFWTLMKACMYLSMKPRLIGFIGYEIIYR